MSAVISECGRYRYRLGRSWDEPMDGKPGYVAWVMLNPSTADAVKNDLTITKCIGFTQRWGYSRLAVVNLFALRATDPKALCTAEDPWGPENPDHLIGTLDEATLVVAAWGQSWPPHLRTEVASAAASVRAAAGDRLHTLGLTAHGDPLHPSRLAYDTELVPW